MDNNKQHLYQFPYVQELAADLNQSPLAPYFNNPIKKSGLFAIEQRMEIIKQANGNHLPNFQYNDVQPWPFNLPDPLIIMAHMMGGTVPERIEIYKNDIFFFLRKTEIYLTGQGDSLRFLMNYHHNGYPIFIENVDGLDFNYIDYLQYIKDVIAVLEGADLKWIG